MDNEAKGITHFTLALIIGLLVTGCCIVRKSNIGVSGENVKSVYASGDVNSTYEATTCVSVLRDCQSAFACVDDNVNSLRNGQLTLNEFLDLVRDEKRALNMVR